MLLLPFVFSTLRSPLLRPHPPPLPLRAVVIAEDHEDAAAFATVASPPPLPILVREAGDGKGLGAFASEPIANGTLVCHYEGDLLTDDQVWERYSIVEPSYIFWLGDDVNLDGANSDHPSRYFNHHQNGTLLQTVLLEERCVQFYADRDIAAGEELTFDYGEDFWIGSNGVPAKSTDDRNYEKPPEPLVVKCSADLEVVDRLEDRTEARMALLRTLDFFGATRLSSSGDLSVPTTLVAPPPPTTLSSSTTLPQTTTTVTTAKVLILSPTLATETQLREACGRLVAESERIRNSAAD